MVINRLLIILLYILIYIVPRVPGFLDSDVTYLLPSPPSTIFQDSDLICKATQTFGNQTYGPALIAPGGSRVVLRYQENGHITLPFVPPGKPNPGVVYVYATTQSSIDDKFVKIHGQWTTNGSGGDQRGYMLTESSFDDGVCFQLNESQLASARNLTFGPGPSQTEAPDRWCGTFVFLNDPSGAPLPNNTIVTLYWVWDWPSTSGSVITLNETYTSCMDILIIDS